MAEMEASASYSAEPSAFTAELVWKPSSSPETRSVLFLALLPAPPGPGTHRVLVQCTSQDGQGSPAPRLVPTTTYKIGQLYMISKHSHEQSDRGEGVEVVQNEPFEDPHHGNGQFTEKRVYLNSKLPSWARAVVPKIFYVTEKAWNYYPYTITEYTCSFLPKFSIHIETKYEDNKGSNDRIFDNEAKDLEREVCFIDIACDEIPERYYKESEDPKHFKSEKTGRGQLREGWRDSHQPIMCSYKLVTVKFEVWGLQTRVEQFVHKVVRDILLIGHRQAFAWVDEWYDMTMDDVREYEKNMHEQTNIKVCNQHSSTVDDIESHAQTST
ncbi:cytoplasmic phosphatidylinositol transfer protein 1 isoform X5 [Lynx rufus]|uniref:cytoplasmic phosphatidylinositol transfer protein 1 isoform X5 n=1 Tax=Lynx rufus TaxID=61384 RepID=UPI001F128A1E|nr:cytoplasmic phosphatidylinositol transfer protein 1 isoform X5 [Lynx rufus]